MTQAKLVAAGLGRDRRHLARPSGGWGDRLVRLRHLTRAYFCQVPLVDALDVRRRLQSPGRQATMTDDNSLARCHEFKRPLTVIDHVSDHLTGCMTCNFGVRQGRAVGVSGYLRELHRSIRGPVE